MSDAPFHRTQLPDDGVPRLRPKEDYDLRSEEGARASLARVAATGNRIDREAVRTAVAKFYPDLLSGKVKTARDFFPHSHMKD